MARVIADLHPFLQTKVSELIKLCEKNGLKIGISECVRTVAEQDALYAKGRTDKSSGIVTNCKGSTYSSPHQWSIAFDYYRNDGKGAYNDSDNFFTKVGKLAQSIGLEWGGVWKSFPDKPHIQLPCYGSACSSRLKKLYTIPKNYTATFYYIPKETVTYKSSKKDIAWLQERLALVTGLSITIDGCFGSQTSKAILSYWKQLDWTIGKLDEKGFYKAGDKTLTALSKFRTK